MKSREGPLVNQHAQARLRDREKLKATLAREDMRHVLSTPQGRRFFWNLLDACNTFGGSFTGNDVHTNFNEGARSVGLRLMADAQSMCPDLFVAAFNERLSVKKEDEIHKRDAEQQAREGD